MMVKRFRKLLLILTGLFLILTPFIAANAFIVKRIRVFGLQRITESSVLSYIPIRIGQSYTRQRGIATIRALYDTNFFNSVVLQHSGSTLIVRVKERPIISEILISGNKKIPYKKLKPVLQKMGLVEGQVYDSAKLKELTEGLKQQYALMGRHAAKVNAQVKPTTRNRVNISIKVVEGPVAKISSITFKGNNAFSRHQLLKNFKLSTTNIFSFFTRSNRYSEFQLEKDLQQLKFFYLDHGYMQYRLVRKQVTISPDGKSVSIALTIHEGPVFYLSGVKLSGPYANNKIILGYMAPLKPGIVFSRKQIVAINKKIGNHFADQGYAFPNIQTVPKLDTVNHKVLLLYNVTTGPRVYVRRISFIGNHRTEDRVLRSEVLQMEDAPYSRKSINESKRKLANLPYLKNITVTPVRVPGHPNQVDLKYGVHEVNAGKASLQAGYSDLYGFLWGINISEPNFMGTGKYVAIGFTRSEYNQNYAFTYNNPLYTIDGVSMGFSVYYNKTEATTKFNYDTYSMEDYGGTLTYGFPLSDYDTASLGFGYDHIVISNVSTSGSNIASPIILSFLNDHPSPFNQLKLMGGYTHSTLDQAIFATKGNVQSLSIEAGMPVSKRFVGYYKMTYNGRMYYPLGYGFIISPHATLGYGNGFGESSLLPFYNNFYGGGIGTLPGFEPNSLGPKNPNNSNGAMGGNLEMIGGVNFIFPNHISDKIRTAVFVDAGNIYQTRHVQYSANMFPNGMLPVVQPINYEAVSFANTRIAAGLLVAWYSPLGLLDFSVGYPIHSRAGDQKAVFGFTFGTAI